MAITDDLYLPSDEEIKHKEIPLTHNFLLSSAMWLGKYCDNQCKDFMLCRKEEMDPRKCLTESNEVTDCGLDFFKKVKKTCKDELEWYTKCLDFTGGQPQYRRCRREQAIFDHCMYESGFERARFGYFQLLRVHDPDRPRPKRHVPLFPGSVETFEYWKPENNEKASLAGQRWSECF